MEWVFSPMGRAALRLRRGPGAVAGGALAAILIGACGGAGASPHLVRSASVSSRRVDVRVRVHGPHRPRPRRPRPQRLDSGRPRPQRPHTAARPLAGRVIGIDPGHNGRNHADPAFIDHQVFNGRELEDCDTTGTATDAGYSEARFTWNVAGYLSADLRALGAHVVLTRHSDDGVGPCVTTRSQIINRAHAAVAVDIHGDGGPADGRGFAILEPVADGPNDHVIAASDRFARILRSDFSARTHLPESTYDGVDALAPRDDLAGLNLTTVPKVLIECGNMRNATDAARMITAGFQRLAARAMAEAISRFLTARFHR